MKRIFSQPVAVTVRQVYHACLHRDRSTKNPLHLPTVALFKSMAGESQILLKKSVFERSKNGQRLLRN
jgi:hypothetical protein